MRLPILAFVILSACMPLLALARTSAGPTLPERNPMRPTEPAKPVEAKPVPPGEQPTVEWTEAEIKTAKEKCRELLTGDLLDYDMLPPLKEGICGTPAPILLRAVSTDPKVVINPPATLSCPMADVLGEWVRETVQPEAKKLFGSTVVKIQNASSYVCRNRYGGDHTPLSEHALANALDVSEFVLANGERITILDDWPKTLPAPTDSSSSGTVAGNAASKPGPADASKDATTTSAVATAKVEPAAAPSPPPAAAEPQHDPKAQFVLYLHEDACRRFGTVSEPEANAAHKNHFHLDMKTRKKSFCE
jgi:hypothetical protein